MSFLLWTFALFLVVWGASMLMRSHPQEAFLIGMVGMGITNIMGYVEGRLRK